MVKESARRAIFAGHRGRVEAADMALYAAARRGG
jgi:hypothetical protein